MKKFTITFYSPKELWKKFLDKVFWPRRKLCAEWMDSVQVELAHKIVDEIVIGKYYNACYIDEATAENLEKDITNAIYNVCSIMKKVISTPYEDQDND